MQVVVAEGALLERILDQTFPVWHEGLSREAYSRWNSAQLKTPWGRERLHRFALIDDSGTLLATLKRYWYDVRLDGRDGTMAGLGAVFTPPERRGQGHATELIERVLEQERRAGTLFAALFSEIGAAFYERLGFSHIPLDECSVHVALRGGAPAMLVRAGDDRDLPAIAAMHAKRVEGVRLSLRKDKDALHYSLSKKRLFAGLSAAGTRQFEFFVAEEGATAVAYVVLSQNQCGWTLEEAGDRDPAGARLGGMLQVLVAREPSRKTPIIRAWWPRAFPIPPQVTLTGRAEAKDLLMVRPLADVKLPAATEDVFVWRGDYF